uniref:Uncharacterized protein n=1 Tax=Romanomermis culicivorax TaxID=13658 RepID=A0A915KHM0_ROMCU
FDKGPLIKHNCTSVCITVIDKPHLVSGTNCKGLKGANSKQEVDDALQALIDIKIKAALEGLGQGLCLKQ